MKKIFFATAVPALAFLTASANGGSNEKSGKEDKKELRKERRLERRELWLHSVDPTTETQFYDDFPGIKEATWTEGEFAEAEFKDGDIDKTAYYDTRHELVGTTQDVDFSALPEKARQYISHKYPGYTAEQVVLFDDNEANDTDMSLFNHAFEDEDNYFPVLSKGTKEIILKVNMKGDVSFFQNYR
jgi:hypothetical protein